MVKIEKSIIELLELLEILNQQIVQQGEVIQQVADNAEKTTGHLGEANQQIEHGVKSSRNARKLKWWLLLVVVLIIIVAVVIAVAVVAANGGFNKNNNNQ